MPIPKGSNAVVMLEYTKERGDTVEIFKPVTPGKNVSFTGEDVKKGEAVLKAGKILQAHDIGMLASLFMRTVKVYKRARIGILPTGDELMDPAVHAFEQDEGREQGHGQALRRRGGDLVGQRPGPDGQGDVARGHGLPGRDDPVRGPIHRPVRLLPVLPGGVRSS